MCDISDSGPSSIFSYLCHYKKFCDDDDSVTAPPSSMQQPAVATAATVIPEQPPHYILFLTNLPEETNEMMLSMLFNQSVLFQILLFLSDVAKLVNIRNRRMRILTFKCRRMQMQIEAERNAIV